MKKVDFWIRQTRLNSNLIQEYVIKFYAGILQDTLYTRLCTIVDNMVNGFSLLYSFSLISILKL